MPRVIRSDNAAVLTPAEVAARWRVSTDRVLALIQSGRLQGFSISSPEAVRPRYRIPMEVVKEFERGQQMEALTAG